MKSFQSEGGAVSMINAALNSARTMAVSRQRYVGVRFQKLCTSTDPADPLKGLMDAPQYMIFIVHEEVKNNGGVGDGFRAMEGLEPIKLPPTDGRHGIELDHAVTRKSTSPSNCATRRRSPSCSRPSGKLIMHNVRVRNADGVYRPDNAAGAAEDVHGRHVQLGREHLPGQQAGACSSRTTISRGRTTQADDLDYGLGEEPSCTSFVIYEPPQLRMVYDQKTAWTDYLSRLAAKAFYVSPYTGDLISSN